MINFFCRLRDDESGATAIEYGLLAALVAVGLIIVLGALGEGLQGTFTDVTEALENR